MGPLTSLVKTSAESTATIGMPNLPERILIRVLKKIRVGQLTVELPLAGRQTFGEVGTNPCAIIRIRNARTIFRVLFDGGIGLAEGYLRGEWDTPDLTAFLALGAQNADALTDTLSTSWISTLINRTIHSLRANTHSGSRKNIAAHYDLGNNFYRLWLDEGMTYSSALFSDLGEDIAVAQRRKYLRIIETLDIRPGDRVLEIGCGWGGFAEIAAAEFGCKVVGLTLSVEQARFARKRIADAGLTESVDIRLEDYRDVQGKFDKIVSIEMFEAVGEDNWSKYFEALRRCLKDGGRAALQFITIANEKFGHYRRNPDFIQRYIFPGGMLPSPRAVEHSIDEAGFKMTSAFYFGKSYAETLRRWASDFDKRWPEIEALGFDARFRRMWRYYLRYCEVGFDTHQTDVGQFVIERI
mgnify:CR=1 FL=1